MKAKCSRLPSIVSLALDDNLRLTETKSIPNNMNCYNINNCISSKCNSRKCKFKNMLKLNSQVMSTATHRIYDVIVPQGVKINCHSSNVVYLITCNKCSLQYVRETSYKLDKIFNCHKSCLKYPKKFGFSKKLSNYFNIGLCKKASFSNNFGKTEWYRFNCN